MLSDGFTIKEIHDGLIFEVRCRMVTIEEESYNTGANDIVLAERNENASTDADEGDDTADVDDTNDTASAPAASGSNKETVIDVVDSFKLVEQQFTKKTFTSFIGARNV